MHFGRTLAHFGLHLRSLWLPLGSLWLPLAPFWFPLAHISAPFGSLFLPFGSLLLHFLTLGVSWRRFRSLSVIFDENLMKKLCFSMFLSDFPTFYAPASAKHLQTNRRNPSFAQLQIFAYIYLSRPGADNCRRQLRSAPGLLCSPRGVLDLDSRCFLSCTVPFLSVFLPFVCFPAVYLPYRR